MPESIIVSIRCTAYNHERYIRQCLEGFVMQRTNFRFEAIVHDDASTDGTANIIREYAGKYPEIIKPILETENLYSKHDGSLRRLMDSACTGKYIAYCEGDDYWTDPLKLQKQVDFMETHPDCTLVFHNAYYENARTNVRTGTHKIYNKSCYAKLEHIMRDGGFIPTLSILIRSTAYHVEDSSPINRCPVGDLRIQVQAAIKGKVYYINEVMGVYRLVASSATHIISNDINKQVAHQRKFIDWYNDLNEFTNHKYEKELDGAIAFSEARIIIILREYFKLWNPKYWPYIANKPIVVRVGIVTSMLGLGCISRWVQNAMNKKKNKI